jgi:hypothetical protein
LQNQIGMRTKTSRLLLGIVMLLLFANISASAFYDPGTQRWLNRDPVGDIVALNQLTISQIVPQLPLPVEIKGPNLYVFNENRPISIADPYGLWGVKTCGINFGIGDPSYDFDFEKEDWTDLKEQYNKNAFKWGAASATSGKVFNVAPSPVSAAIAAAADGAFVGSLLGYGISAFWENNCE